MRRSAPADLLGALDHVDGGTIHARALPAIFTGPGRRHEDGVRLCRHLGGGGIPCRAERQKVPFRCRFECVFECATGLLRRAETSYLTP